MSEQLENLLKQMQELTDVVKNHREDPATIDFEQLKDKFQAQIDALVETRVKAAMDARPAYRMPGDAIAASMLDPALGKNIYRPMLKDFAKDGYHQIGNLKARPLDLWLSHYLLSKASRIMPDQVQAPSVDLEAAIKAMTSDGSGTGDELVPTNMASQLWEDFFLSSRVAGLFDSIPMPSNPFDVPLGLGDVTWRKGGENTATTASDPTTAKSTLTATELVAEVNWSYTLQEDSIVALMPAVRARLALSGAEVIDAFVLNADSTTTANTNINCGNSTPPANAYYLTAGQKGLRYQWLKDNTSMAETAGGDALADADITAVLGDMGKYAVAPERMAIICDVATYLNGFLALTNVTTVDKFGPGATILTGQLAAYRGIPIVVSASASLATSDGTVDPTGNTLGSLTVVNRTMWHTGFLRNLLIEVDRDIQRRQYIMVASLREAVGCHGTRSSNTHTGGVYDILV